MDELAPGGPVYQAGTLSGNPVATAAGLACLSLLDDSDYKELATFAGRLGAGLASAGAEAGFEVQVPVAGPLVGMFFGRSVVRDYEGARASAGIGLYPPVMRGLLGRGIAIAPGPYEVLFPSLAHGQAELERTVHAFSEVARGLAS
jgi:glutamate-1-semialdehyde 2,1-aminomutase